MRQIHNDKVVTFHSAPPLFVMNKIYYLTKVPHTRTPFIGEVIFDLLNIDNRSRLSLSETQIMALLSASSSSA